MSSTVIYYTDSRYGWVPEIMAVTEAKIQEHCEWFGHVTRMSVNRLTVIQSHALPCGLCKVPKVNEGKNRNRLTVSKRTST